MSSAAPKAAAAAATPLSNEEIALYTDVLILFVLLFFMLTALPRIIARLTHASAWRDGWIILRGSSSRSFIPPANDSAFNVTRKQSLRRAASTNEKKLVLGSTESETWESSFGPYDGPRNNLKVNVVSHLRQARGEPVNLPTRCPSYHSLFQPLSRFVSARYAGYSVGQYVLLMGYAALMMIAMFLYSSPVNNITRAGFVCISQIPVVFALGTKNSLAGWLVGMGYEKVRWDGIELSVC
jgi:ferric-chelate reductase